MEWKKQGTYRYPLAAILKTETSTTEQGISYFQVRGLKRFGWYAELYTVIRCHTRGESEDHTGEKAYKGYTLALKSWAEVTRSPKQGYQWPHKKDLCPPRIYSRKKEKRYQIKEILKQIFLIKKETYVPWMWLSAYYCLQAINQSPSPSVYMLLYWRLKLEIYVIYFKRWLGHNNNSAIPLKSLPWGILLLNLVLCRMRFKHRDTFHCMIFPASRMLPSDISKR